MLRRACLVAALVLATASLTGCIDIGGDDGQNASPSNQTPGGDNATPTMIQDEANLTPYRFKDVPPVDETMWVNGSLSPTELCTLTPCPTASPTTVDIAEHIPQGLPVTIQAELTWETTENIAIGSELDLVLEPGDSMVYEYNNESTIGYEAVNTTLLPGSDAPYYVVRYESATTGEPDVTYTLEVNIEADPTVVPSGAPIEATLEPGQPLHVQPARNDTDQPVRLQLHGPNDEMLTREDTSSGSLSLTVPTDTNRGDHVLVVPASSSPVRILTNATDPTMRPLQLALERGDPHATTPFETTEWTFDTDQTPLSVGIYYEQTQPAATGLAAGNATLTGPNGTLFSTGLGCPGCITAGYYDAVRTPNGAAALSPGTYTVTYEAPPNAGYSVGHFILEYER